MVNDSFFINNYSTPEKLTKQVYTFAVQSVPVMSPEHVVNELSDLDRLILAYQRKQNVPNDFRNKIAYYQAILMQRKGADDAAAVEAAKKKKKTVVGGLLKNVADFSVDVAKLGVQGLSLVPNALNGGKSVLGKEWDPTTGLGKLIDSGVDKADALGHKVGQIYVKTVTGGAVDLSKGGIFQKGGLEKSIDLEKLAAKGASVASSAAAKSKDKDSNASEAIGNAGEGMDASAPAAALDVMGAGASALESTNFKSKDMNALDFLNKASTTVLGADTSSLQNQYTDIAKAQAEQLLKDQFNSLVTKKKTNPTQQIPNAPIYSAPLGPIRPIAKKKPVQQKHYVYPLGWVNNK